MRILPTCFIATVCLVCSSFVAKGQGSAVKLPTGGRDNYTELIFRVDHYEFRGEIDHLNIRPVAEIDGFSAMEIPGLSPSGETGYPALPQLSTLFEAGQGEDVRIRMIQMDSVVFDLQELGIRDEISPVAPSVRKGAPAEAMYMDSGAYNTDGWLGAPVISVEYEGKMRGISLSTLRFNPVRYNPARNMVKVYYNVSCTIATVDSENSRYIPSEAFSGVFSRVVTRSDAAKKAVFAEEPMTLVILSDTMFRETLQPLVQWKTSKGFRVVEAYRQDNAVGSSRESIKAYLNERYTNPSNGAAPTTYLLIVGDVEHIPLSQSGGEITDLYYAEYDGGGDYIPDVFYGRISVASVDQLQAVLDKILEYEQHMFPDPSFLDESVLIAGVDGTFASSHGNGQINYAHNYYLNDSNGHHAHMFPYPESGTSDSLILDLISRGVGFVNYTGHGLYDRWIDPTFHQNDIDRLENLGKYPVMIGNGCETNVFTLGECFAEALLRAPGRGALAYIGCTNDSYWDEDYYWAVGVGPILAEPDYEDTSPGFYDRVFHSHEEPYGSWTPSLGEMIFGGNMAVQGSNSSRKKFYWEIYQLAGDPTIVPWFARPSERVVRYPEIIPEGTTRLDVTCAPFDYVALSQDGKLLDALHATGKGFATLQLPDSISEVQLDLVVSGDRFIPFRGKVEVGEPQGAYLDLVGYGLTHESVEADGLISSGEHISFDLHLINRGASDIQGDTLVLFSSNEEVAVLDSMVVLELLEAGDSVMLKGVFRIRSEPDVVDRTAVVFGLYRTGDQVGKRIYLNEKIHAPVLTTRGIHWDDRPCGNGNGVAEQEEWLVCHWTLLNTGHFRTGEISGNELPGYFSVFDRVVFDTISVLEPGDMIEFHFRVKVNSLANGWQQVGPFTAGDQFETVLDSFTLSIGRHFEDFNTEETDRYPFMNRSDSPWKIDGGTFVSSPFSFSSGSISSYGNSELTIMIESDAPDTLSFWYRVSSETGYDFLRFYTDSVLVQSWSGEKGWDRFSTILDKGNHQLTWAYQKDQSISKGEDAAWIDDISFPATAFRRSDLSLVHVLSPGSGPWLDHENVSFLVRNTGLDTIPGFAVEISLNGQLVVTDTLSDFILPGESLEYVSSETIDLSGMGIYQLHSGIHSPSDYFTGNNWLETRVDHYNYPDIALSLFRMDSVKGVYSNAILEIENLGNTVVDSLSYELWIDGLMTETGVRFIGMDPGQLVYETFRLIDSLGSYLTTGYYNYVIRSAEPDSVMSNNEVSGVFYWHALGLVRSEISGGLLLYPNPAREGIHLVLPEPAAKDLIIELITMNGWVIGTYTLKKGEEHLHITTLPASGNYLLKIVESGVSLPVVITD